MVYLPLSHSQKRGAFCSSADGSIAYRYWVKHPVLLDSRPADCVTTSASNMGCFVMSAKNGKPCIKCGANEWNKDGKCTRCTHDRRRRRYRADPEGAKEYARLWKQANAEAVKKSNRRWRQENWEAEKESARRRYQAKPEADAAKKHHRRTRKTAAGGSFTASEWKACKEHFGNKCVCCGRDDVKLTADHVIPVSKGGSSNIDNIQPLCGPCNSRKWDKTVDYRPASGIGRWIQRKLFGE